MNTSLHRAIRILRAVIDGIRSDQVTFIAASLAYYAFVSLIPLLLLAIVVMSVVLGPESSHNVSTQVTSSVGKQAGELVEDALIRPSGNGGAAIASILVLLWSGLKLFRGLDVAFSTIYEDASRPGLLAQLRNGLITLLGVGAGIGVTILVGMILTHPEISLSVAGVNIIKTIAPLAQITGLTLTFMPLYYVLPGKPIKLREAVPGAVVAAIGWTTLQTGFSIYATQAGKYAAYGAIGGVLLIVTFLYFGGLILLVGVVLNATLFEQHEESEGEPTG